MDVDDCNLSAAVEWVPVEGWLLVEGEEGRSYKNKKHVSVRQMPPIDKIFMKDVKVTIILTLWDPKIYLHIHFVIPIINLPQKLRSKLSWKNMWHFVT